MAGAAGPDSPEAAFDGADDGFASFASGADSGDDFGDFGDFGGFGSAADAPPVPPARAPPTDESTLALGAALLRCSADRDAVAAVARECMEHVFGAAPAGAEGPAAAAAAGPDGGPARAWISIEGLGLARQKGGSGEPPAAEPRLLRNLALVAVAGDLPGIETPRLLTPLAELKRMAARAVAPPSEPDPPPLLPIDEIRRIAALEPGHSAAPDLPLLLRHALRSIDALTEAKAAEAAKRRDAVDVYNQVIQTLVAQASKLH
ncbi:hypothetical protein H4R18_004717 [Coemansia javaensis]|uniref:Uncharacterized protein n=1 Tax=Coemansia javaensis TaxID=2761396 RepID=A0A9W8LFW3_9FUNG|nr:hypothetical protein H4R18_004717 [Coemansia javaensis]